jgi:aquaporin related protein
VQIAGIDTDNYDVGVGPGAGAIAAVLFYKFIKILEYEMANPGQEAASAEAAVKAAEQAKHGLHPVV